MKILIVEDEQQIANAIERKLTDEGFVCDIASDGKQAEEYANTNSYDAIILDIMLPKQDGWETCVKLRNNKILVPILMLTALDDVDDKIKGLDTGADDYLAKPFHFGELVARLRSLIRRNSTVRASKIELFDVVLDQNLQKAYRNAQEIILTTKEFMLLQLFMLNANKILSRTFISEHLWDMNFDPRSNVIESYIKFLRQKIDKGFSKSLIHTVRGAGYIFSDKER